MDEGLARANPGRGLTGPPPGSCGARGPVYQPFHEGPRRRAAPVIHLYGEAPVRVPGEPEPDSVAHPGQVDVGTLPEVSGSHPPW